MTKAITYTGIVDKDISGLLTVLNIELPHVLSHAWGVLRDVELQMLKHHLGKGRKVVQINLQTTTGKHELIGKVYSEDRSDVYRAMKQISECGFGPKEEFSIPQPFAYIPGSQLLLQEKVQGHLAKEIFLTGNVCERTRAAERCACWLARFHREAPKLGKVFEPARYVMNYELRHPTGPTGSLGEKVRLLLKQLESTAAILPGSEMCSCHGGYCHHQIILTETRTATFDWDNYKVANPAWDVARFIVSLEKLRLRNLARSKH